MLGVAVAILITAAAQPGASADSLEAIHTQAEKLQSREPLRARTLYEEAARQGHAPSQASLGILLFKEGNRTGALRWLKSAADAGEPRAQLIYGTATFNGDGVAPNRIRGYAMVRRAAEQGSADARATQSEMELVMPRAELDAGSKLAGMPASAENVKAVEETASTASASPGAAVSAGKGRIARAASRPTLAQAAEPRPASSSPAAGAWRIQLGAFRQPGAGQALFARLAPQFPGKQAAYVPAGSLMRLQVGPYATLADANAACRSLGQQVCLPVRVR